VRDKSIVITGKTLINSSRSTSKSVDQKVRQKDERTKPRTRAGADERTNPSERDSRKDLSS
jgi:hypothetical protein